jgi:transcription factor C subunit 7
MPVTEILILRHGHRLSWTVNPATGEYTSTQPFPTGLPADPPLVPRGVRQSQEVALHLREYLGEAVKQDRLRIYSSLFYRCLETLEPTVNVLAELSPTKSLQIRGERGIGEWFGRAWFPQPKPEEAARLRDAFFPWLDETYESKLMPADHGEKIHDLHERVAKALAILIQDVDDEFTAAGRGQEPVTLLLCSHAATLVASARALTGQIPDDYNTGEFKCFTCGLSKFVRRAAPSEGDLPRDGDWRNSGGIAGGWDCALNSDCTHLAHGEENGWRFNGDEHSDSYEAASKLGIKIANGSVNP